MKILLATFDTNRFLTDNTQKIHRWSSVLPEKQTVPQRVKNFSAFFTLFIRHDITITFIYNDTNITVE